MIVDIAKLPPGGERFKGMEPASVLELPEEEPVRVEGPTAAV